MNTNLIERYVAEIGKHLPFKERKDIRKEIQSTLEDMLEERTSKAGGTATEEMVVEMLREFGKPDVVAASYQPARHLIGPSLYPVFSLVISIVLPILAVVLLITMGLSLVTTQLTTPEALKAAGNMLLEVMGALVSAFGSVVLTFAILERVFGFTADKFKVKGEIPEAWNPHDLPETRELDKFSIPGLIAEIAFTLLAVVVFNFFPQIIGFISQLDGKWNFQPVLSEAFFGYMPYLNALWGLQIVINLILLQRGHWETATRWLHIAMTALGISLTVVMLAGPDLIGSIGQAISTLDPDISAEGARFLTRMPQIMVKVALLIVIVLNSIEVIKSVFKEITHKVS